MTMTCPKPILAIFYRGGRRPWALKCAMRDAALGLVDERNVLVIDEGFVATMRSKVATHFLERKLYHPWLLTIDGDMRWREDTIPILGSICCECRGIVGAVVSRDSFGAGLATRLPPGEHRDLHDGSSRSVPTCEAIGSPTAIHRDALALMVEMLGVRGIFDGFGEANVDGNDANNRAAIRQRSDLEIRRCGDEREQWWGFFKPTNRWNARLGVWSERADDSSFTDRAAAAGVPRRVALGADVEHWGEYGFRPIDGMRGQP